MKIIKKDALGNTYFFKWVLLTLVGFLTYPVFRWMQKVKVSGTQHLRDLPATNVLFVSNHQTYYADVIAIMHAMFSHKMGYKDTINNPIYLINPSLDCYYVAAEETMKDSGIVPKLFSYAGAVTVKRSWRSSGTDMKRNIDFKGIKEISTVLKQGMLITFPQGTTKPFAPGRRGTALTIKDCNPIVIPVVIDGFRRAFNKKGLVVKKPNMNLSIRFKAPLQLDHTASSEEIMEQIMDAIEQSPAHRDRLVKA